MSTLWRGLKRRSAGLVKNPRHFVQLLLPTVLILCGWLALALEWWPAGLILVSAALFVFAALIWFRLRRIQARIDTGLRAAASRPVAVLPAVTPWFSEDEPADIHVVADATDDSQIQRQPLDPAPPPAAVLAGVPAGLLRVLDAAAPTARHSAVLVVPSALRNVVAMWVEGTVPGQWSVVGEQSGLLRSRAAGAHNVIIVDSEELPSYEGVLDQSFFWWLPRDARLFLVSHDVFAFAARLAREHDVDFALTPHGVGSSQASVTRKKG